MWRRLTANTWCRHARIEQWRHWCLEQRRLLFNLDVVVLDDARPRLELITDETLKLFGRSAHDERHGNSLERRLDLGLLRGLERRCKELVDDRARRFRGHKEPIPVHALDPGVASLRHGRNVRIFRQALLRGR